jgi:hypothetical protein
MNSKIEEIIAALWLCAALLASIRGYETFSAILFVKAGLDVLCSIGMAVKKVFYKSDKGS